MSQLTAHAHGNEGDHLHGGHGHGIDPAVLAPENVNAGPGFGKGLMGLLGLIGVVCLGATAAYPFIGGADSAKAIKHALASYHVGFVVALSIMLGSLAFVLIMNLVKAGWSVTIRRQAENVASLIFPLGVLFALPVMVLGAKLFKWFDPALAKSDPLLAEKVGYLNPTFFYIRIAIYFAVWSFLAWRLCSLSREQDRTGDKWLSNKASFLSAGGILAFALTIAFAGIDLLKTLDFHWFSTMFGVYFFAGSILSAVASLVLLMIFIRSNGKLKGLFTQEHSHDMGKLVFAFMVFWAYIGFSQYFLYWYANIPEETAWVNVRGGGIFNNAWTPVFWLLCIGHFIAPFPLLLVRKVKQTTLLGIFAFWLILMHCVDIFWLVRPMLYPDTYTWNASAERVELASSTIGLSWVDFTGVAGPLCILFAAAIWKMSRSALIPINDPRLPEAATHKNYV